MTKYSFEIVSRAKRKYEFVIRNSTDGTMQIRGDQTWFLNCMNNGIHQPLSNEFKLTQHKMRTNWNSAFRLKIAVVALVPLYKIPRILMARLANMYIMYPKKSSELEWKARKKTFSPLRMVFVWNRCCALSIVFAFLVVVAVVVAIPDFPSLSGLRNDWALRPNNWEQFKWRLQCSREKREIGERARASESGKLASTSSMWW